MPSPTDTYNLKFLATFFASAHVTGRKRLFEIGVEETIAGDRCMSRESVSYGFMVPVLRD